MSYNMDDVTIVFIVVIICVTIIGLVMMYYENQQKTIQAKKSCEEHDMHAIS